ncbi:hypothetical protein [Streptomyces chryseus]|uniref:hypothetical protein n=1 Tax=Streptomyces chryseus TaxID=68186 RepID=UPI00110FC3B3|nr:hypothetical protein [Streptomyces chryseus]
MRTLATAHGPLVTNLLQAHLTTVVTLIDTGVYDTPTERRLHICAAELASTFGWLLFDQGRHGAAQRLWSAALHAAYQADDRDLGAGCLADLAYLATWLHHPAHAVTVLDHAATRTRSPAALSLLHVRRARALATLGDTASCTRALTAAGTALDHATPGTTPTWVSWMSPAVMQSVNLFQRGSVSRPTYCLAA